MAAGHQAVLEVGILAQSVDEEISRDDERQHEHEADQCRPAAVRFVAIVGRLRHARHTAEAPLRGQALPVPGLLFFHCTP